MLRMSTFGGNVVAITLRARSIGNNRKPVSERESGNLWLPIERRKPFSDLKPLTFDLTSVKQRLDICDQTVHRSSIQKPSGM